MNADAAGTPGAVAAELDALTAHAGICRRDDRLMIRLVGDDRVSFLHGMCSNDIKGLQPGMVTYALVLTDHAHIVADLFVWADESALYLEADRASWPATRDHLEKFLVADDVEIEEQEQSSVLDVVGPQAITAAASVILPVAGLAPWHMVKDGERMAANLPRIGLIAVTMVVPTIQLEGVLNAMLAAQPDSREVGLGALEVLRIEQGLARVGLDATARTPGAGSPAGTRDLFCTRDATSGRKRLNARPLAVA